MLGLFILLAIFALTPIVIYFIYDFLKVLYSRNRLFFVIVLIAMIVAPYSWYKNYERETYLSYIPQGLNVSKIVYAYSEEDTTLVIYELPVQIADNVQKYGLSYLKTLLEEHKTNEEYYRNTYSDWKELPLGYKLINFYDSAGSTTNIDPKIIKSIMHTFMKKKNYMASGRYGKIVVIPSERKVFLLL